MGRFAGILMVGSALTFSISVARQAQTGQWKNYTDMKAVRSIDASHGRLFAASGGGMFAFDEGAGLYTRWTNSENLSANDLTALSIDPNGRLWIGSSTGSIDVYDPAAESWRAILDIQNSSRPQKTIRSFFVTGDSVLVTSDFGVSVFLVSRWEFRDTYADFGFANQPAVVKALVYRNQVCVATDQGVAIASLASPNLSAPTSWTLYASAQGLTSPSVSSLMVFHDTLVAGTANGMYAFAGAQFQQIASSAGKAIVDIKALPNSLVFVWNGSNRFTVEGANQVNGLSQVISFKDSLQASSLAVDGSPTLYLVGTTTQGVAQWDGTQWKLRIPNGPQSNQFISMCVDGAGIMWGSSGISGAGRGFYRFDPSQPDDQKWKNFTYAKYPQMGFDDYYKSSVGAGKSVWISTWGRGVLEMRSDTIRRVLTTTTVPSFVTSVAQDPSYAVIGGAAVDQQGDTWFVNRSAVNGNILAKLVSDSVLQYVQCLAIPSDGIFTGIVIDQNGTKWMANSEPYLRVSSGLFYYNEDLSVSGTANTGGWGNMTATNGLPNGTVLSVAVDLENNVWVGTDLGVTIITNPQNPLGSTLPSFPLREQSIQTIAVDALNNKWVGTKEGIFVVNADGTQLLNQYNVLNTNGKLVDNDVRSIAIDQRRGVVYIGTEKGLSSLQIAAVQTLRSFGTLELGPNPYTLPNLQPMSINNLVANSTVKILTVSGALVSEFSAQGGGRAFWDGRDRNGALVPTGVYFVVAYADNGNQVAKGKIAVVRK